MNFRADYDIPRVQQTGSRIHPAGNLLNSSLKEIDFVSDAPILPLNLSEMFNICKLLLKSALPTSATSLAELAIGLVCFHYLGNFGKPEELAGLGIGFTWVNLFCLAVFNSINQGFSVLAARLYGAGKLKELGILFQRNLCVLGMVTIPLVFSLIFSETILLVLGLEPAVAASAGLFLRCAIPSVIGAGLFNSMKFFLIAQNVFYIQGVLVIILAPLHVFWCHHFIHELGMSVVGAAIAKGMTDVSGAIILYLYIRISKNCKESWVPWSQECLENWLFYLKKTLLLGANVYIEWLFYEISIFIISMFGNTYILGAYSIAINLMAAMTAIPLGNSISMQMFMANAIGQGSKYKAQKFMIAGLNVNLILSQLNFFGMLLFRHYIALFFTNEEATIDALQTMILIYSFSHLADTTANHIGGVLKVLGKERQVFRYYIICFIGLAFNLQWFYGIFLGYGYIAVWISLSIGIYAMLGFMIPKLIRLDWDEEIRRIQETEALSACLDEETPINTEEVN